MKMKMMEMIMIKFKIVKDVEKNDVDGGCIVVKVNEDGVERNVVLGFDFGDSLGSVEIMDSDERMEDVFSNKVIDSCWNGECWD